MKTAPITTTERMQIASYDSARHICKVKTKEGLDVDCIPLSSTPTSEQGAGFFIAPPIGSTCVVHRTGHMVNGYPRWTDNYLIGYHTDLNTAGTRGGTVKHLNSEQGDATWHGTGTTFVRQERNGVISFVSNLWATLKLSQVAQALTGALQSMMIRFRGGKIEWMANKDLQAKLHIEAHDRYEPDAYSDVGSAGGSKDYANKAILDAGNLTEKNILTLETRQDTNGDNVADETYKLQIGRPGGGALSVETVTDVNKRQVVNEIFSDADLVKYETFNDTTKKVSYEHKLDGMGGEATINQQDNETTVETTGRGSSNRASLKELVLQDKVNSTLFIEKMLVDPTTMYDLAINSTKYRATIEQDGKITMDVNMLAQLIIDAAGNLNLQSDKDHINSDARIKLGGSGNEQPIVLYAFIPTDFLPHVHIGNLGTFTSPPVRPVATPANDSHSNSYSYTTMAE